MSRRESLIAISFLAGIYFLIGNAGGVPQAVTKAPGEANHNSCATCHSPGNFNPSISLDVMNPDSSVIKTYVPGETYIVRVKVKGINNPKTYGFQMSCLDSMTNTDMGNWTDLGSRVKIQNFTVQQKPRKYLVQSAPKTDGIFTAKWKAPSSNIGTIKFYFTGLASDQKGSTNGDSNVFGNLSLAGPTSSSITQPNDVTPPKIFPNPASDFLEVEDENVFYAAITDLATNQKMDVTISNGRIDISSLKSGMYIVLLKSADQKFCGIYRFVKI